MSNESNEVSHDPFDLKYLLAAVGVAVLLPLMHVFLGMLVYLFH